MFISEIDADVRNTVTNSKVLNLVFAVTCLVGPQSPFLATVKRCKFVSFGLEYCDL